MKSRIKIFIDFDGTITNEDVGEAIFNKFGEPEKVKEIIDNLLLDKISSKDCWYQLCDSVKELNINEFNEFIDSLTIDYTFHKFIDFCKVNNFEMFVLSDGFDYYIKRIFKKEGLSDLIFYANKLIITNGNKLVPSFPYQDEEVKSSANCKRNHVINHSSDEEFTVFIGDGNSDKDTAEYCDFIFAKNDLLKFCERERISYFPYKNFNDVKRKIEKLTCNNKLKKRHQAVLKRRTVYMQG